MGFLELLTIVFIVLKLTEVIDWSWLLVFLPLLLAFTIYCLMFIFYVFVLPTVEVYLEERELDRKEGEEMARELERKNKRY